MKNNRMDEWMEVPVALISTLLMLLVSWFVFDLFGFSCDQTWQFILFMIGFLALDLLFGELSDRLELWLVKNRWIRGILGSDLKPCHDRFSQCFGNVVDFASSPWNPYQSGGSLPFCVCLGLNLGCCLLLGRMGSQR